MNPNRCADFMHACIHTYTLMCYYNLTYNSILATTKTLSMGFQLSLHSLNKLKFYYNRTDIQISIGLLNIMLAIFVRLHVGTMLCL